MHVWLMAVSMALGSWIVGYITFDDGRDSRRSETRAMDGGIIPPRTTDVQAMDGGIIPPPKR